MFVDHVDNARCHGERNNSKDDGEGLAGPTDYLIQCPLLIWEAMIIGPHVCDDIVVRLFTVLVEEAEVAAQVLLRW